ncbi:hypothetical protein E2C01_097212 [Portunus trituberculatus]|uniref:Uncharacterized protein n=1 Tax=Portunus trituberculatus TaxID=210409 RepID=A0A5B7K545_PORTR|nr:hypothetical protein [Portunus trituberculatus]
MASCRRWSGRGNWRPTRVSGGGVLGSEGKHSPHGRRDDQQPPRPAYLTSDRDHRRKAATR